MFEFLNGKKFPWYIHNHNIIFKKFTCNSYLFFGNFFSIFNYFVSWLLGKSFDLVKILYETTFDINNGKDIPKVQRNFHFNMPGAHSPDFNHTNKVFKEKLTDITLSLFLFKFIAFGYKLWITYDSLDEQVQYVKGSRLSYFWIRHKGRCHKHA